jgi:hypothetical protein
MKAAHFALSRREEPIKEARNQEIRSEIECYSVILTFNRRLTYGYAAFPKVELVLQACKYHLLPMPVSFFLIMI